MTFERILVTGGAGRIGRVVASALLARGAQVRIVDCLDETEARARPGGAAWADAAYVRADITDYAGLHIAARDCDTVLHLAALASPTAAPADEVFGVNVSGTFNVFRVAEELGIRRVVQASSINVLGHYFGTLAAEPRYLPIDEDHPGAASDAYSLAKQMGETIAAYHWRRSRISSVSLRLPWVLPGDQAHAMIAPWFDGTAERVLALPEAEQRRWVDGCLRQIDAVRARRLMEDPAGWRKMAGPPPLVDTDALWFLASRLNLFTLIDERDAAAALIGGLLADYDGAHPLYATQARNALALPAEALARGFFPGAELRRPLLGDEGLVDCARASALIGYAPRHHLGVDG